MLTITLEQLFSTINTLELAPEARQALLSCAAGLEKELAKRDFMIKRTIKDKEIATNLLKASLRDLKATNTQLSAKNEEISQKNQELSRQKLLLEASSQKLEQNLRDLQHSYEAHEQFSYIASHDLKTPLRTIASYAQLLQRRHAGKLDNEADEFIGFIVAGAKHMNDIICDLLEYSRTSIKNQPKSRSNLNLILKKVLTNLRQEIEQSGATIQVGHLPTLDVYDTGITQLFQNLITNALKFKGGQVPHIEITAEQRNDVWQFSVSDNGSGIEDQYFGKIFQPFQRLQTQLPGLGMGLTICKKIVQNHHGDIWVKSKLGTGSVFCFTIPDAEAHRFEKNAPA